MWNSLRRFLAPPTFEGDEDKTRSALYIHWFTLAIMVVIPFLVILTRLRLITATIGNSFNTTLLILFLLNAFVWGVSKSGRVAAAGYLLIAATWLAANVTAYSGSGVSDSAFTANFVIITAVTLLLGWRQAIGVSALTILAGFGITYAKAASIAGASFSEAASLSVLLGLFAALLFVFTNGLSSALSESRASAKKLEESNRSVSAVRLRLEENQDALQAANEQLQRRAERIDAVANISRTITLTQETERILPLIATAIGSRLGYSHVGVYLLDENGQNVLLSAASSEEGLQLMHNKSRVSVAPDNIIGFVVSRGAARAIQTEAERISLDSPDSLPNSRSRLVLPLKVQERAIGALDIQSERAEDFAREDFSTLQVLADQAAIAIQTRAPSNNCKTRCKKPRSSRANSPIKFGANRKSREKGRVIATTALSPSRFTKKRNFPPPNDRSPFLSFYADKRSGISNLIQPMRRAAGLKTRSSLQKRLPNASPSHWKARACLTTRKNARNMRPFFRKYPPNSALPFKWIRSYAIPLRNLDGSFTTQPSHFASLTQALTPQAIMRIERTARSRN